MFLSNNHKQISRVFKYNFRIKYAIQRLNEKYGINNWKFDKNLPNIILKDGTQVHFGETPDTEPSRPYGISQNGLTRVKVEWSDGTIENNCLSSSLLVEKWDFKGLHFLKDNIIRFIKKQNNNCKIINLNIKFFY